MKKILLFSCLIILIPFIVINIFIENNNINFKYVANMNVRIKRDSLNVIEEIPLEDYIIGVVAAEMPVSFEIEALKAQAVAARTYVMRYMQYNKDKEYDVVDTVLNQVYLDDNQLRSAWADGYDEKINKVKSAVVSTYGQYMTYDGEIIQAFFFSTSSGKTENSEDVFSNSLPYLKSVDSSWDKEVSSLYTDTVYFDKSLFLSKLNLPYSEKISINIIDRSQAGTIKKININNVDFKGVDIRSKLNLKSANFEIVINDNNISIITKGFGHGVGLSQYGAQAMALKNYKYEEILKHYYQGIEISKI